MSQPPVSLLQRLAQDLNRSYLHGARAKSASDGKARPLTVLNGQQGFNDRIADGIEYTYKTDPPLLLPPQNVDQIKIAAETALKSTGAERERLFGLKPMDGVAPESPHDVLPTWVCHQKAYSLAQPPLPLDQVVLSGAADDEVRMRRLPPAVLREIAAGFSAGESAGVPLSICKVVEEKPANAIPSDPARQALVIQPGWRPGIMVRCPVTPVAGSNPNILELGNIPQHERWYVDLLGLLDDEPKTLPANTEVRIFLETETGTEGKLTRIPIEEWVIARQNLTGLARPGSDTSGPPAPGTEAATKVYPPYTADENEFVDTVRLFQMASITSSQGYYLRTVKPANLAAFKEGSLVLCITLPPAPGPEGAQLAGPSCNAARLDAGVIADMVRFHGLHHVEVQPYAPAGCASFGWKRKLPVGSGTEPTSEEPSTTEGFARTLHLVDFGISDKPTGKIIDVYSQKIGANGRTEWAKTGCSDDFGPALSPLKPLQGTRVKAAQNSSRIVLSVNTELAGQPAPVPENNDSHFYYTTVRYAHTGVYKKLNGSTAESVLEVRAGFRDMFGNRFFPQNWKQEIKLEYFDALLAPSEWTGVRMQMIATGAGKVALEIGYTVRQQGITEEERRRHRLATEERRRQHQLILDQLNGAGDDDVRATLVDAQGGFTFTINNLLKSLRDFLEAIVTTPDTAPALLQLEATVTRATATESTPTAFLPLLRIERTKHLPDEVPDPAAGPGATLPPAMLESIRVVASPITLASRSLSEPGPTPNADFSNLEAREEFEEVARQFGEKLGPGWQSRASIWRNRFNEHEVWLVPEKLLPEASGATPPERHYGTPRPLSTERGNATYEVPDLSAPNNSTGRNWKGFPLIQRKAEDVDYDAHARKIFAWLETLLSPARITTPGAPRAVTEGLLHKEYEIASILGTPKYLVDLYKGQATSGPGIKRMGQDAFRRNLGLFYGMDTFMQQEIALRQKPDPAKPSTDYNYYGKVEGAFEGPPMSQGDPPDYKPRAPKFSDFVLNPLKDEGWNQGSVALTLVYDLAPGEEKRWDNWTTKTLAAQVTHIQLPEKVRRHEFDKGQWLQLVEPKVIPLVTSDLKVPAIIRAYPPPAVVNAADLRVFGQKSPPSPSDTVDTVKDVDEIPRWGWKIHFSSPDTTNDSVDLAVTYDQPEPIKLGTGGAETAPLWVETADLLADLILLEPLANQPDAWWNSSQGEKVLAVLPDLLEFLRKHLEAGSGGAEGAMVKKIDKFKLRPHTVKVVPAVPPWPDPIIPEDKVDFVRVGNTGEVKDFEISNKDDTWIKLFGTDKSAQNFQPSLNLTRNEALGGSSTLEVNDRLIYRCGTRLWREIVLSAIGRTVPVKVGDTGTMAERLSDALRKIMGGNGPFADMSFMFHLTHSVTTPKPKCDVPTPHCLRPLVAGPDKNVDEIAGELATAYAAFLKGATAASYLPGQKPCLYVAMQVSRLHASPPADPIVGRVLLECVLQAPLL